MRRAKPAWFGRRRGDDDRGYGRVTAPERYRIVTDAAFALIEELVEVHGTTRRDRAVTSGDLDGAQVAGDAIEVVAANGARIVIIPTTFPGVLVRIDTEPLRPTRRVVATHAMRTRWSRQPDCAARFSPPPVWTTTTRPCDARHAAQPVQ